jgi:ribonuclease Z
MAAREFVALGTAGLVPTRDRSQNAYFLRWDAGGVLFDPGDGAQRQLTLAGVSASQITRICITHLHGDHCLGLPGVIQRISLDRVTHPVDVYFPASGAEYVERLLHASIYVQRAVVRLHPVDGDGGLDGSGLQVRSLDHRVDTIGYRVEEPDGRRFVPERLASAGISGPDVSVLAREGSLRGVRMEDVTEPRRGQKFAFVMDTRPCAAAVDLARDADLVVCEATFLDRDASIAEAYGHLTAGQAAAIARDAGAHRLALTHHSQRYTDVEEILAEARSVFPETVSLRDLDRISLR